jgi:hypothetical protein
LRCNKIRVTSLIDGDERATWIGVTLAAGDNLAALAARSPELPLSDTAEAVGRPRMQRRQECRPPISVSNAPRPAFPNQSPKTSDGGPRGGLLGGGGPL